MSPFTAPLLIYYGLCTVMSIVGGAFGLALWQRLVFLVFLIAGFLLGLRHSKTLSERKQAMNPDNLDRAHEIAAEIADIRKLMGALERHQAPHAFGLAMEPFVDQKLMRDQYRAMKENMERRIDALRNEAKQL